MGGRIRFHYNPADDYVAMAIVDFTIETDADIAAFMEQAEAYFKQFGGKKKDVILDMGGFKISAAMGKPFGKMRGTIAARYFKSSYRFNVADPHTKTFTLTSAIGQNNPFPIFDTQEEALQALRADRRKAGTPSK